MVDSYFEALEMIKKDPTKSYEIMGADVKQTGEEFAKSAAYLRWQDKAANQKFFAGEIQAFSREAADLLLEVGDHQGQARRQHARRHALHPVARFDAWRTAAP